MSGSFDWLMSGSAIPCLLLEASVPYLPPDPVFVPGPPGTGGVFPVAPAPVYNTLRLSSLGYTTPTYRNGIAVANTAVTYDPCLLAGLTISESISLDGQASLSFGDLEIFNPDGNKDVWLTWAWRRAQFRLLLGDVRWQQPQFQLVAQGRFGGISARSLDVLNVSLLSEAERLNNPITEAKLGGTSALKERLLPVLLGQCHNVEPLLAQLLPSIKYKVSQGALEGVIEVRDSGSPRTDATPSLATGEIMLAAATVGQITVSARSLISSRLTAGAPPATPNVAELVLELACGYGPAATRFSLPPPNVAIDGYTPDVDGASFTAAAAACPQPMGYFAKGRKNILEACQEVAQGVGYHVTCNGLGQLKLVRLALPGATPAGGVPHAIGEADIEVDGITLEDVIRPRAAIKLGYCRNWTVQPTALATGLNATSAASFATEYLTVTAESSSVKVLYQETAEPPQEDTLLLTEADALAEVSRRLALWGRVRRVFAVRCYGHLLKAGLGDACSLSYNRYGLSNTSGVIIGIERDWVGQRCTLRVLT